MARIESPSDSSAIAEVDKALGALRVTPRPMQALGYYRWAGFTGAMTAVGSNTEFFQFRWTDATNLALIQFLRMRMLFTACNTPQEVALSADLASGWTVDGSGGTSVALGAPNLTKRTSFPQTKVSAIRVATTAGLNPGTRTLDASSFLLQSGYLSAVGNIPVDITLDLTNGGAEYPIVLVQNEGLILRNTLALSGTNAPKIAIEIAWAECSPAQFPTF